MDTSPYPYIAKAIEAQQSAANPQQVTPAVPSGSRQSLSLQQQAENYNAFSKLMEEGVYLPDMVRKLGDMEARIKTLESQPRQDANAALLATMEAAVKNDPKVKASRQKVADIKTAIISEMCMRDSRYREAIEDYKIVVNEAYIRMRESDGGAERTPHQEIQAQDGGGAAEVRDEPGGGQKDQARLSRIETDY